MRAICPMNRRPLIGALKPPIRYSALLAGEPKSMVFMFALPGIKMNGGPRTPDRRLTPCEDSCTTRLARDSPSARSREDDLLLRGASRQLSFWVGGGLNENGQQRP